MIKKRSQLAIIIGVVAVTSVVLIMMNVFKPTPPLEVLEDRVERLEAISAKREDVFPIVTTQAVVESRFNINLKSQVTGQIVYISPKFLSGGFFDTDEVILRIDPSDYELALVQAEVNVARAEQALSVEKEQAELARLDWEKYGEGEASELVLRIPQLKEAEAALKGAQANYDTQRIRLERTEVKAPFPLMIANKAVDLGQVVSNNQDLAAVFGTEEAEIRMPLSQKQIDLLDITSVGILPEDEVLDVKIHDYSREDDVEWDAKILRVESSIDRKSRVYYAIATIEDPMNLKKDKNTPPLLPGVFVELDVQGPKIENVFKVPARAMNDDSNIFIYEDEKLITKPVKVLDQDEDFFTIISGIEEGERIATSPPFSYVPGMKAALASLDGVPMGGNGGTSRAGGAGAAGGARPAGGGAGSAVAAEVPNSSGQSGGGNRSDTAETANMTPEQRAAARARNAASEQNGQQTGTNDQRPQGGSE